MLFPFFIFPLISAAMWLGMLLAMLIVWLVQGSPHYVSMEPTQSIAYISDIGATSLKPLFITGCVITTVFLDLSFAAERWLRHTGALARNTSFGQKVLSAIAILFAVAGTIGLILLSIFDTVNHPKLHDGFLLLFVGGYIISAIFICAEYQRLGIHFREHRVLRISFWVKLAFIIVEAALAIAFGITTYKGPKNVAAVLEWVVALIFTFWVLSFLIDLLPASKKSNQRGLKGRDAPAGVDIGHDHHMSVVNDGNYGAQYGGQGDGYENTANYTREPRANAYTHGPETYQHSNGGYTTTSTVVSHSANGQPQYGHSGASQGTF